jgi:threonyl-tRNA synthetase
MKKLIKGNFDFEKTEVPADEALAEAKKHKQIYKAELIEDLLKKVSPFNSKKVRPFSVSFYRVDGFVDLCAGPHVESTRELDPKAFKLVSIAGAYWRGSEKNKMLQRIYAIAFDTAEELAEYERLQEEAKKRDHRKLGQELDLFSFHDEGPGFPFWHPRGMVLRNLLTEYWRNEH